MPTASPASTRTAALPRKGTRAWRTRRASIPQMPEKSAIFTRIKAGRRCLMAAQVRILELIRLPFDLKILYSD